jgi:hypothetical protein
MPRVPIDYSKVMIYKLVCRDTNITDLYVGNTTDWRTRKSTHKSACCNEKCKEHNQKKYVVIRENGGWSNWEMVLIEKYPCKDGIEARQRERYWTEQLTSQLNTRRAYRSEEERKEYGKEYGKEYMKGYYEKNADKLKEYRETRKDKMKEYRENHKEKMKEYMKGYYEKNADKMKEQMNKKVPCPLCNKIMSRCNLIRHTKRRHTLCSPSPVSQANSPSPMLSPVNPTATGRVVS